MNIILLPDRDSIVNTSHEQSLIGNERDGRRTPATDSGGVNSFTVFRCIE